MHIYRAILVYLSYISIRPIHFHTVHEIPRQSKFTTDVFILVNAQHTFAILSIVVMPLLSVFITYCIGILSFQYFILLSYHPYHPFNVDSHIRNFPSHQHVIPNQLGFPFMYAGTIRFAPIIATDSAMSNHLSSMTVTRYEAIQYSTVFSNIFIIGSSTPCLRYRYI